MGEYYPAALEAFDDLADRDALAVLGRAPTPELAAQLSLSKIRSALKHAGRQRNIDARARQIAAVLRTEQLAAPAAVTAAFAATTRAAVSIIIELNRQIADLEAELATHFYAHPDADIYLSLPGPGVILGARVPGEFGDDPNRYTTAKSRQNYAGTSSRPARNAPYWPTTSATGASTTPSTNGPAARSPPVREHASAEVDDAVAVGFDAKVAIHPSQVPVIRAGYASDAGQIAWARRVLDAAGDQRGVFELDGKMIDIPVLRCAERIIAMAPQDPTA